MIEKPKCEISYESIVDKISHNEKITKEEFELFELCTKMAICHLFKYFKHLGFIKEKINNTLSKN